MATSTPSVTSFRSQVMSRKGLNRALILARPTHRNGNFVRVVAKSRACPGLLLAGYGFSHKLDSKAVRIAQIQDPTVILLRAGIRFEPVRRQPAPDQLLVSLLNIGHLKGDVPPPLRRRRGHDHQLHDIAWRAGHSHIDPADLAGVGTAAEQLAPAQLVTK